VRPSLARSCRFLVKPILRKDQGHVADTLPAERGKRCRATSCQAIFRAICSEAVRQVRHRIHAGWCIPVVCYRSKKNEMPMLGALFALALAGPAAAISDGTVARLVALEGSVLVSWSSSIAPGTGGMPLAPGVRVLTTARSWVVLEYYDGCRVRLSPGQRFEVSKDATCGAPPVPGNGAR
jgi:hypothetical protein